MNKLTVFILALFISSTFVSCGGNKDIDELYFPYVITLDKYQTDYVMGTVAIKLSQGDTLYMKSEKMGKSLSKLKDDANYSVSGKTSLSMLKTIIIGSELSKESIKSAVKYMAREDIDGELSICTYEGESKEIINMFNRKGDDVGTEEGSNSNDKSDDNEGQSDKKLNEAVDLIIKPVKEGYKVRESLFEFIGENQAPIKTAAVPLIKDKDNHVQIIGTSIFKSYRKIADLNLKETESLIFLRGEKSYGVIEVEHKHSPIKSYTTEAIEKLEENSNDILASVGAKNKRKVSVEKIDNRYVFNIEIDLKCKIIEANEELIQIINNKDIVKTIEEEVSKKIKEQCEAFIQEVKTNIGYDIFDLVKYLNIKNPQDVTKVSKDEFFDYCDVNVEVKARVS